MNNSFTVLSYKPRGLNIGNIIRGKAQELLRLGTIRDLELTFSNIIIKNIFGFGELFQTILLNMEKELVSHSSIILGHVGILKQIFSPGLRASQVLSTNDSFINKIQKYTTHVSSDALELASRTTISIETTIDSVLGNKMNQSKFKKRHIMDKLDINVIVRGISISLLNLQNIIDPKQGKRNNMRYGH